MVTLPSSAASGANNLARYDFGTIAWSAVPGLSVNDYVYALANAPNGGVLVGGYFASAGGIAANDVAEYNRGQHLVGSGSGHEWVRLCSGPPAERRSDRGRLFPFCGRRRDNQHRAYHSPATNAWSTLGAVPNGDILALVLLPNGDLIAGGYFASVGGVAANNIARYNAATNTWSAAQALAQATACMP